MVNNIVDKNGKSREIIILTESEKEKRRNLKEKLEAIVKPEENVYSFVKGKSVKQAVELIAENIDKYKYFLKIDIENYFESINVEKIINILGNYGVDYELLYQIKELLKIEESVMGKTGIALGSPLSNYLSNIYLKDIDRVYLNEKLEYIRFCDDIFILTDKEIYYLR